VDDVKSFFGKWYIPNNASLVVAGDFDANQIKATIQKLFGPIPKGAAPMFPAALTEVKLTKVVRETIPDNVQFPKVVMAWHSPARYAPGDAEMDLASVILQEGKASRLYKALVYDKRLAQEVTAYQASGDIGSQFVVEAIAAPKVKPAALEAAMDAEIAKLTAKPVSGEELRRAQNQFEMGFVARLQSVMQRAAILNQYEAQRGDPGYAEKDLDRYRKVTPESLQKAAKGVLDLNARVILHVLPKEEPGSEKPAPKGGAK
jgi:zinc protease